MLIRDSIAEIDFDVVRHYVNTGESAALTDHRKELLAVCVDAYGILAQCPARMPAVNRLRVLEQGKGRELSLSQASRVIDFARHTWGDYMGTSREFLDSYLCNLLMQKIADPNLDEDSRIRYTSLMQKHIAAMPAERLDPRLVEKNTINLSLTINAQNVNLTEQELAQLPQSLKEKLLQCGRREMTEEGAAEILG